LLKRCSIALILAAVFSVGVSHAQVPAPAPAQPAAPVEPPKPNDYRDPANWLCRPGGKDACAIDLTTTIVTADGKLAQEKWTADPKAPIDCFYVYPTVSTDPGRHSDMKADPAETNVIAQQFARFASKCRPFAPLYRQVTLAGLRQMFVAGGPRALGEGLGYDDVRDAWHDYLKHDNQGRGVVLVGHSQGSYVLIELLRKEIEGKPVHRQLVSAILMGTTVTVPKGKDVGGSFQQTPLCRSASQTGCVITFATYRSTVKPPKDALFGRVDDPALIAACTNPAALGGTSDAPLHAYLAATGRTITGTTPGKPWVTPEQKIETPWVSVPGLLTAKCASNEFATYLELTVHGNPEDPRVDDITGDLGGAKPLANWGMHLVDVNLAMGNLLEVVGQQGKVYAGRKK
jgi:hypothetical protein